MSGDPFGLVHELNTSLAVALERAERAELALREIERVLAPWDQCNPPRRCAVADSGVADALAIVRVALNG